MTSDVSNKKIKYFLGSVTEPNHVTFSTIQLEDNTLEFYVSEGSMFNIETKDNFIGYGVSTGNSVKDKANMIRTYWNSNKLSGECQATLKAYYNDYFKYDDFFEEVR